MDFMPFLFFPSQDVLRLALCSGAVPHVTTSSPARIATTDTGAFWLAPSQTRFDLPLSLARFGVQVAGLEPPVVWRPLPCWALALPLRPCDLAVRDGLMLLDVPMAAAAHVLRQLRQAGASPVGVFFPERESRCWITIDSTEIPARWHHDPREGVEIYGQAAPHLWVQWAHEHPACDRLVVPASTSLLLRAPHQWESVTSRIPNQQRTEFSLTRQACETILTRGVPRPIPVRFRLVPGDSLTESLWLLPTGDTWENLDPALLRRFEATEVRHGGERTFLVRRLAGTNSRVNFSGACQAFTPHPRLANLFLPPGRILHPMMRETALAKAFAVDLNRIAWLVESREGGLTLHSAPASRFRPLNEFVAFSAPPEQPLMPRTNAVDPFVLPSFSETKDHSAIGVDDAIVDAPPVPIKRPRFALAPAPANTSGWLGRSLQQWLTLILGQKPREALSVLPGDASEDDSRRVGQTLSSPDTLLHGTDWPARRRELESKLVEDLATSGPAARTEHWVELATVYGVIGNAADAAICWMNAIWDSTDPPRAWLKQWVQAEAKLARVPPPSLSGEIFADDARAVSARLIAAWSFTEASPLPPLEHEAALAFLDRHAEDLPVRSVWLALSRLCENDPLALARGRDRLLARLRDTGPGLDLDEPSFLRSHGTASAERFQQARDWLTREQEPIRAWFRRTVRAGRLRDVGLEAETTCTRAYIDLLIAWGLGCVGERAKSQREFELAAETLKRVENARPQGQVHGVLLRLFTQRIREAQDGRAPKAAWPTSSRERFERLTEFDHYCVNRLRSVSHVLEPRNQVNAFGCRDHRALLGTDRLGEQLHLFLDRTDPLLIVDEAQQLLAIGSASPRSDTVPRVAFALLEFAPHLDSTAVSEVLSLVPPALDWLETWLQSQVREESLERDLVAISARMIERAMAEAAARNLWAEGKTLADDLLRRLAASERRSRLALRRCAAALFRSLHSLGLSSHTEAILRQHDSGLTNAERLGCAIGWFHLGRDDVGTRFLDEARDRLYLVNDVKDRERTRLAIAYADALGAAPPRIAMGRLEELFQRLGPLSCRGSTNTYFTLSPLHLIDTVVRAVVGENFTLGPRVQSWLEDDEFLIRQRIQGDMGRILREFDLH